MPEARWADALEIQSLEHARGVLAAISVSEIFLKSPERALETTGSRYWLAMISALAHEFPQLTIHFIIDAGDAAGLAQGSIADGHRMIRFTGDAAVKEKLQQIATTSGSVVL